MLFVRLFDGLPCFRILDFNPVEAGFSIAIISICHVSEKARQEGEGNFGKSDGANVGERRNISKKGRGPFMSHEEGGRRLSNNIIFFEV